MTKKYSFTGLQSIIGSNSLFGKEDEIQKPGLAVLTKVSVFLFLVCVFFIVPFRLNDSVSLTWFFLAEAVAFGLIPILARRGFENTAKMMLIIYIDIGIIILSSTFGSQALIQAFFIPAMGLSILLFDAKHIRLRNISIIISIISYVILDYVFFDTVRLDKSGFSFIRWSVLTASFITTWLIFNTFSEFKEEAEQRTRQLLNKEKELNQELSRNQSKLERYINEIEEARVLLEQSTRAKSEFLATMSHEIRTPMNAIMGMTHLLQRSEPREDQQEALNILDFSGKTLLNLIDDILDFSKIEAGRIEFEQVSFELDKLVGSIFESFRHMARNKGLELEKHVEKDLPTTLIGDPSRLTQILNNLLSNALKFTEEGSVTLRIETVHDYKHATRLRFSVSDTGIGIERERLESIFDSFTQASGKTKRLYGGTGLGLTISRQLVRLQGGEIEVESRPGEGSTFTVELEFEKGVQRKESIRVDESSEEEQASLLKGLTILLAEDNLVNQKVMARFLQKWDIELTVTNNGAEAVEALEDKRFDLILMDLQMPEMDGFEATRQIRTMHDTLKRNIPIIALTAAALKEVKEQVYASGMNDFVTKPFNPSELQEKILFHTGRLG